MPRHSGHLHNQCRPRSIHLWHKCQPTSASQRHWCMERTGQHNVQQYKRSERNGNHSSVRHFRIGMDREHRQLHCGGRGEHHLPGTLGRELHLLAQHLLCQRNIGHAIRGEQRRHLQFAACYRPLYKYNHRGDKPIHQHTGQLFDHLSAYWSMSSLSDPIHQHRCSGKCFLGRTSSHLCLIQPHRLGRSGDG